MVNFKKIDDYLYEYLEAAQYDIVEALSYALNTSKDQAKELYNKIDDRNLELEMVNILGDEDSTFQERTDNLIDFLHKNDLWVNNESAFNYIDLAEDYNYRRYVKDSKLRGQVMDWLEDQGYDYLIDTKGNFAIKCPKRNDVYYVNRNVDHIVYQWNKPEGGKAIDADDNHKKTIDADDEKSPALRDTKVEAKNDDTEEKERNKHSKKIAGPDPAKELTKGQYKQKVVPDKTKYTRKKKHPKKIDEGVIGSISSIDPISRMRTLAGLPEDIKGNNTNKQQVTEQNKGKVIAVYDNPEKTYEEGGTVEIQELSNGYYGSTSKDDFQRDDLGSLIETLKQWNFVVHVQGKDLFKEYEQSKEE